jgi:SAM-dependent methyltransferase
VDPWRLDRLGTAEGGAALAAAGALADDDPLVAVTRLRAAGFDPELAADALSQARLRRRAAAKFGPYAEVMFFTPAGLEQATRAVVADRRADRLAAAGVRRVADLGCGVGADTIAFARAGLAVLAVESDPGTAAVARANVAALGLAGRVEVRRADATGVELSAVDAAFCDPARRDAARGTRLFDPDAFSPPWSYVTRLARLVPTTVLKLAPGLDHRLIPPGTEAEWVSVDGDLVEAALWSGEPARAPRRASVLRGGAVAELTGPGDRDAPLGTVREYLYDPDPAVVRARLVAEFAGTVGGALADPHIAYVFADRAEPTPYARCLRVTERLPFARKALRAALRVRGIGRLEIRKRGVAVDPAVLRRELRLAGEGAATLVLARFDAAPVALLCQPGF